MDEAAAASPEHTDSAKPGALRGLAATVVEAVRTRLELATVELEIYAVRLVQTLVWAVAAVACLLLAVAFGLVTLIVALWDTHRIAGLLGGMLGFLALAVACALGVARSLRRRPALLEGTLGQLEQDQRSLGGQH